ncbi:hypothetical protein ACFFV7_38750 [Nonomuraea spiralis]|uniref:Uncharacterized protein n=1 Tax=Nonomuraea spiralis TaxID=46182 RepID=A0ABV5IT04_9ACTN|nr:hypothetical protein [Nonomuraea spiralis]GGT34247.1 hypothetical protein GCM10010176_093440 [Nonomuraea spiralis]
MTLTMLTYTLLTDPAPLEASQAGRSLSKGKVYLVVTNNHKNVDWLRIEVTVPAGNGDGDLTPNIGEIMPKGTYTHTHLNDKVLSPRIVRPVTFQRWQDTNTFRATPPDGAGNFSPGDYMVLALENITVAEAAGLAVLLVEEIRPTGMGFESSFASVPLMKAAPKEIPAPRDFRPDKAMLDVGDPLTLSWEGSADFDYKIRFPGGDVPIPPGARTWSPDAAPKRATTYTLVAVSRTTPQQEHFLTTTVQVRHPALETLTATTGIDTPWVQGTTDATKGRVTFTDAGVAIFDKSAGQGTVTAGRASVRGVNTEWVQGRSAGDGWITFPVEGLKVHRKDDSHLTHLDVGYATHDIVKTRIVRGLNDDDGWISFRAEGLNIRRGRGTERGTLFAANTELKE